MTTEDKMELLRLINSLRDIDTKLERGSILREGLIKAALALEIGFIAGHRHDVELLFAGFGQPLAKIKL